MCGNLGLWLWKIDCHSRFTPSQRRLMNYCEKDGFKLKFKLWVISIFILVNSLNAQNMWMWNQRTHPELTWQTLETKHFKIHYHQGIEEIALKGAKIAEQAYQPTLDQLQVKDFGKTDIVFSAEDEVMNGFAMPSNQIFIWVSQNDVAGNFGGSEKWLKLVITHEFQHVVQFQAHRTWAGILGGVTVPAWWLEGMAEYMTEVWRVGRSDSKMKIHTYRNTMDQLNPHDDGYAKVLYMAWKYGDSTLVKISKHRLYLQQDSQKYPYWYNFNQAFEDVTGQTLKNFNDEWRRVMNTYYYGYKAQKETIEEVGKPFPLKGFAQVRAAALSPDSLMIAVVGRKQAKMRDYSLYSMTTDSSHAINELHFGQFTGRPAWSPDAKQLLISEYHRGKHGSLLNDLRLIDLESKKVRWITHDLRALHPVFSLDCEGVFFVAHPGETTQLYYQNLNSGKRVQLSQFVGDVQIQSLDLAPDGQRLTFMIQEVNGDVNIAIMGIDGQQFQKVTNDPEEDLDPVWTADGRAIVFTSYRNSTPNLYRIDLDSLKMIQMTDVAEGLYSRQRLPGTDQIITATLGDVDTVRIRTIESGRVAPALSLNIRDPFNAWRTKSPDIAIPEINYELDLSESSVRPYRARKTMRPLLRMIWPDVEGIFGLAVYMDALGKHLLQGGGVINWSGEISGGYFSYINLQYLPHLNFFGTKNIAIDIRHSAQFGFIEYRNGAGLAFDIPMNTGFSLSANHTLQGKLQAVSREILKFDEYIDPESGNIVPTPTTQELNIGLTYLWKSQRPHADRYFLPRNGSGILAHIEKTIPSIWGDNDHTQYWVEGFFNYGIPKLPVVLYSRLKYAGQQGSILVQDELGFSEAAPLYFSTAYMTTIRSAGIFDATESYGLRGQTGHYSGSDLVYSTTELRMPLLEKLPVNILGLGLQNLTAALFFDLGYLPQTETQLNTYGAELKFDLTLINMPLITLAFGRGGNSDYWSQKNNEEYVPAFWDDHYLRLALVNPF